MLAAFVMLAVIAMLAVLATQTMTFELTGYYFLNYEGSGR